MPSTNAVSKQSQVAAGAAQSAVPTTNSDANAAGIPPASTMEYEVLVIPPLPDSATEPDAHSIRTSTKRITCTQQNGTVFWIPEGYRPVLVRTTDLPLLVGAEYPGANSDSEGDMSA